MKSNDITDITRDYWYTKGKHEAEKGDVFYLNDMLHPIRKAAYTIGFKEGLVQRMLEGSKNDRDN